MDGGSEGPLRSDALPWAEAAKEAYGHDALVWAEVAKEAHRGNMMVPPSFMMLRLDLLDDVGWKRLLPYDGYVDWHEFKKYLEDYFTRKAAEQMPGQAGQHSAAKDDALKDAATLMPGQAGQHSAAKDDALKDAATLCLDWENKLFKGYFGDLAIDDITLIIQIRNRAKEMIKSSGDQSVTATVGMECIAKEAELMLKFLECEYDTNKMVAISNKIRRSALNLMLGKGSESIAAAGAMVGATKEAALFLDLLSQANPCDVQYDICDTMRQRIALVLTKLEKEFSCDTDAANNTSDNMGFRSRWMIARD